MIAVDGTGRLACPERHHAHCMTQTHNGKWKYLVVLTEDDLSSVRQELELLMSLTSEN